MNSRRQFVRVQARGRCNWSQERESSSHSLAEEEEEEYEEDEERKEESDEEEEGEVEGKGEEDDNEEEDDKEVAGQVDDNGSRPFILPLIWKVNDFYPTMSPNIFNKLCDRFQILENIPIRLPRKFEKCNSGKITDIGMYGAMFAAGLRLPLTELHHQLANYLGLSVSQIAHNA